MRIVRTLVFSSLALGAGTAALTGTANGSTPFTIPTSIATVEQDANAGVQATNEVSTQACSD